MGNVVENCIIPGQDQADSDQYYLISREAYITGKVDWARRILLIFAILVPMGTNIARFNAGDNPSTDQWVYAISLALVGLGSFLILYVDIDRLVENNRTLIFVWSCMWLIQSLQLYSQVLVVRWPLSVSQMSFFVIYIIVFGAFLTLTFLKDKREHIHFVPTTDNDEDVFDTDEAKPLPIPTPEVNSNLFSQLYFSWLTPLVSIGHQRPVKHRDLYSLCPGLTSRMLGEKLQRTWNQELKRQHPSLLRAMRVAFGSDYYLALAFKLIYDTLLFVAPLTLNLIIAWLGSQSNTTSAQPLWQGIAYAVLALAASLLQSCLLHQYFHRAYRTGIQIKSASIVLIFQKALKINSQVDNTEKKNESHQEGNDASENSAAASITNLISVDAQRLQDLMTYLAVLISAPYQISVAITLLFRQLGIAVFAGIGVMVIMIPISGLIANFIQQKQQKVMNEKDVRINATGEMFSAISIVKMYAWELSFFARLNATRERELGFLRNYLLIDAVSTVIWTIVPLLVSISTFAVFVALGNELSPAEAFTSLALFNILRFPVSFFPTMISTAMEVRLLIFLFLAIVISVSISGLHNFNTG